MFSGQRLAGVAARHATVGVACAVLNIIIIYFGTEVFGVSYIFAVLATSVTTIPIGYILHRRVSFRASGQPGLREFLRFLSQQIIQFLAGFVLLSIGVEWLGLSATVAMVFVTMLLWVFALTSQWMFVFHKRESPHDGGW